MLRLASAELLRAESQTGDPVLILDDVFAELDLNRRARLAAAVAGYEQVLITAAVGEDVPAGLRGVRHDVVMTGEGRDRHSAMTLSRPRDDEGDDDENTDTESGDPT